MFIVINFLQSTALAASLEIWYIVFLFSIISKYLPFFLVISSLTHSLFCNILFNFYVFVSLPKFILFLVSNFILLWVENIFYLFFFFFIFFLFLAVLGLRCCVWAFSSCGKRGLLFAAVLGLLTVVVSLVEEHRL